MRSQIRSYSTASLNVQDGISLAQTAESALSEVSNILGRMRELAVSASNGTLNSTDRGTLQTEFGELQSELSRISTQTEFNGIALLDGSTSTTSIQVGIDASQTIDVTNQNVSDSAPRTFAPVSSLAE